MTVQSMDKMANEVADMNSMLHILKVLHIPHITACNRGLTRRVRYHAMLHADGHAWLSSFNRFHSLHRFVTSFRPALIHIYGGWPACNKPAGQTCMATMANTIASMLKVSKAYLV